MIHNTLTDAWSTSQYEVFLARFLEANRRLLPVLVRYHLDLVGVLIRISTGTCPVVAAERRFLAGAFLN